MPPKTKFSREDIVNAAFELTREKGIEKIMPPRAVLLRGLFVVATESVLW